LLKSVGSNWLGTIVTIGAAYVLTPFAIHTLGVERYGVWALIASITGYLGLLMLGVPMAAVRHLAQHVAKGDQDRVNTVIGSCAALYLGAGIVALIVGAALFEFFAATYPIPAPLQSDAYLAFAVTALYIAAGFLGLLPEGVMAARDEFVRRNAVRTASVLLRVGLTLMLLRLVPSLATLAIIQLGCLAFDFSLSWLLIRRRYPHTRMSLRACEWSVVRGILSFSVYVLLLQAGARLSFETDALVIGAFLGVETIPYFTVANSLIIYLMEFIVAIAAVVMPTATRLNEQQRRGELTDVVLKWSKIALSLTLMGGLFLLLLGSRFIAWWIDPSFEQPAGQVLQVLVASYLVFLPVRGVALPVLMGLGKARWPAIGFLVAGVLNLVLSLALVKPLGLTGVAIGTAIPNALFAVLVLTLACRELEMPVSRYLKYVVPRAVMGALPVAAVLLWFREGLDVRSLGGLGIAGLVMALVFALIWVTFVYRNDRYVDLRGHLTRLLARRALT
jgi:O-antigen/teichoic acid export membrane protein